MLQNTKKVSLEVSIGARLWSVLDSNSYEVLCILTEVNNDGFYFLSVG